MGEAVSAYASAASSNATVTTAKIRPNSTLVVVYTILK